MKQELKGGAEEDWIATGKRIYCYLTRAGVGSSIKRGMNKRARREALEETRAMAYQDMMETHDGSACFFSKRAIVAACQP